MSKLFDQSSLKLIEEELNKKSEEIDEEKVKELIKKGNRLCLVEKYDQAANCFEEVLKLDSDSLEAKLGYVRAISEDYQKFDNASIDQYMDLLVESDEDVVLDNKNFFVFYKNWKKYLEDNPRDGIFKQNKVDELMKQYEYKKVLPSLEYYSKNKIGKYTEILASFYCKGIIVNKDVKKALKLYEKAFSEGIIDAAFFLGNYYKDNLYNGDEEGKLALEWYEKGAEKNQKDCIAVLKEVERKRKEAFDREYYWLLKADEAERRFLNKDIDEVVFKSLKYYLEKENNVKFNFYLGECYLFGWGTAEDEKKAIKYEMLASDDGNSLAMMDLGVLYASKGLFSSAFDYFLKAANLNVPEAVYNVGYYYLHAIGVKANYQKALEYLEKAYSLGYEISAGKELAKIYFEGVYAPTDYSRALELYQKEYDRTKDYKIFKNILECYKHLNDYQEYVKSIDTVIENKDVNTIVDIAKNYETGLYIKKNLDKAFQCYMAAANLKDPKSSYIVAEYCSGNLVKNKLTKQDIFELYLFSASNNIKEAYYPLALCYKTGKGTLQNLDEATKWLLLAIDNGHQRACYEFVSINLAKLSDEKNKEKVFALYKKMADSGNYDAKYQLANCYKEGLGTKKDYKAYLKLLNELNDSSDTDKVNKDLIKIYEKPENINIDEKERLTKLIDLYKKSYSYKEDNSISYKIAYCYKGLGYNNNFVKWLEISANNKNKKALKELAEIYIKGEIVTKSLQSAYNIYLKAADFGYSFAYRELFYFYIGKNNFSKDYKKAYECYLKCSQEKEKYPDFSYMTAICYEYGIGVEPDFEKALKNYIEAADNKNCDPSIFYKIGKFYEEGIGTKISLEKAIKYYKKGDKLNDFDCIYKIATFYENGVGTIIVQSSMLAGNNYVRLENSSNPLYIYKAAISFKGYDDSKYFNLLKKAADLNVMEACKEVGDCYLNSCIVPKICEDEAIKYYKKGIENKDPDCHNKLGVLYFKQQNFAEAIKYFEMEVKDDTSYYYLGNIYYDGLGCNQDYHKAFENFMKLDDCKLNSWRNTDYTYKIALMYKYGLGTQKNLIKSLEYMERAKKVNKASKYYYEYADLILEVYGKKAKYNYIQLLEEGYKKRNELCSYQLGICYLNKIFVKRDKEKAFNCFRFAAIHNEVKSMYYLAKCYDKRIGTRKDKKQALEWYEKYLKNENSGELAEDAKKRINKLK